MRRASTSGASSATQLMDWELIRKKLFCPLQLKIEDVPVYVWRYAKGLGGYLRMMDALECREIDLSPFLVAAAKGIKIPVTPLVNPVTGFSSHFIIRMIDDEDERYKVDCLIIMAFRRWKILKGWSRWYRFRETDMILPDMFDPIKLSVKSGYNGSEYVRPGGVQAMRTMFMAFAQYPDFSVSLDSLQKACYCFMATVPESRRQRSVFCELIKRISTGEEDSTPLQDKLYDGMHSWTKKGKLVLPYRRDSRLQPHHLLPSFSWLHPTFDLLQLRDLIGEKGEVLLINHNRSLMGILGN